MVLRTFATQHPKVIEVLYAQHIDFALSLSSVLYGMTEVLCMALWLIVTLVFNMFTHTHTHTFNIIIMYVLSVCKHTLWEIHACKHGHSETLAHTPWFCALLVLILADNCWFEEKCPGWNNHPRQRVISSGPHPWW